MALFIIILREGYSPQGRQKMMGHETRKVFIVQGKRTPFGKFGGSLGGITPVDLAVIATKSLLEETKITPETLDQVIFANVIPSTPDTLYAGRLKKSYGISSACIGGGQGIALLIKRV